jgi:hypothetical protein
MKTVTIGRTVYKINDDRDIFAEHAKCTGKHKIVKSKGPERRYFPDYFYSTADYVTRYYALNSGRGQKGRVVEDIKAEFALSDFELGLLGGAAFSLVYVLAGFPAAVRSIAWHTLAAAHRTRSI